MEKTKIKGFNILLVLFLIVNFSAISQTNSRMYRSLIQYTSPFTERFTFQLYVELEPGISKGWDSIRNEWLIQDFPLPQKVIVDFYFPASSKTITESGILQKVNDKYAIFLKEVFYIPALVKELPKKSMSILLTNKNCPAWITKEVSKGVYCSHSVDGKEQIAIIVDVSGNNLKFDFSPMFKLVKHNFSSPIDEFISSVKVDNSYNVIGKTIIAKSTTGSLNDFGTIYFDKNSVTDNKTIISSW